MRVRLFPASFFMLLLFFLVIIPLLSPLRNLGVYEPAILRNWAIPFFLLLMFFSAGVARVIHPKTWLHYVLLIVFVQSVAVGVFSGNMNNELRNYLSHLFQIISAYVMLGVGASSVGRLSVKFWRSAAWLILFAVASSTLLLLCLMATVGISRLYTPAYSLIFVYAFFAVFPSNLGSMGTWLLLLVSNKRGPLLSILIIAVVKRSISRSVLKKKLANNIKAKLLFLAFIIFIVGTLFWARSDFGSRTALGVAVNVTSSRLASLAEIGEDKTLEVVSSGRISEMISAYNSLEWYSWFIGNGAGSTVVVEGRDNMQVHNIHFTPLSLIMVFGLPFAIVIYGLLPMLVLVSLRSRRYNQSNDVTIRLAPYYLVGSLVHSIFAYSIFIDLLVFFFVGVMLKGFFGAQHGDDLSSVTNEEALVRV